jgi:hypothetical protein
LVDAKTPRVKSLATFRLCDFATLRDRKPLPIKPHE